MELCLVFFSAVWGNVVGDKIAKWVNVKKRAFKANTKTFELILQAVRDLWRVLELREPHLCYRMMYWLQCKVWTERRRVLRQRQKLGGLCSNPGTWQRGLNLGYGCEKRKEMPQSQWGFVSVHKARWDWKIFVGKGCRKDGMWLLVWEQRWESTIFSVKQEVKSP